MRRAGDIQDGRLVGGARISPTSTKIVRIEHTAEQIDLTQLAGAAITAGNIEVGGAVKGTPRHLEDAVTTNQ